MSESFPETSTEAAISTTITSTPTSTSETTTSTSTSPAIEPLVTPFVQPPSCTDLFTTITTSGLFFSENITSTIPLVFSNTADPLFSACQQPGWDRNTKHRFSFSPAVCPSAWTAHAMLADSKSKTSSAYCCSRGYTYGWPPIESLSKIPGYNSRDAACYRALAKDKTKVEEVVRITVVDSTITITMTTTTASTLDTVQRFAAGVQMHQPYQIAWQSSDVPVMSPRPPQSVCSGDPIQSWVPGEDVSRSYCSEPQNELKGLAGVVWFLMIGVPLIAIAAMGCCIWCCCAHRRHKRLDKEEARVRRVNQEVTAI